ncbi:MAG TPA: hypothetical protein VGU74_10025, partial [Gemmatimonadales bacterium]|nr:hypothetical protein [Gemmatimonadales bacterium]
YGGAVHQVSPSPESRPAGCLLRIFWMGLGNLALLMMTMLIIQRRAYSLIDAVYWVIVAALIAARYVDITRFHGLTASAEPATRRDFGRYGVGLVVAAAAVWISAHLLVLVL